VIIAAALGGFAFLGYHATEKWAKGLKLARLGEFADVAEQIRRDVKKKLDDFIKSEEKRLYTEYQYYYADDNIIHGQQEIPVFTSPLSGQLEHGLAYGHFQIGPDGSVLTPNDYFIMNADVRIANSELYAKAVSNTKYIKSNVVPILSGLTLNSYKMGAGGKASASRRNRFRTVKAGELAEQESEKKQNRKSPARQRTTRANYPIGSLENVDREAQLIKQHRVVLQTNEAANVSGAVQIQDGPYQRDGQQQQAQLSSQTHPAWEQQLVNGDMNVDGSSMNRQLAVQPRMDETVQVRIEPFVPLIVPGERGEQSIFDGQVFLVRHVQIEGRHFWQGFQLNEKKLIEEVKKSANHFMREGMSFELVQTEREGEDIAYRATLDFGFGDLLLDFKDNPVLISGQISELRRWYFAIVVIVLLAVTLGLVSLWRHAQAQIKLAQKKDDFISAVSHELRTPLTSIRMYSEMLERDWVKSGDKLAEYYKSMRQESERLSRLIENVLDFSRIQRGRKKYTFSFGDLNECIEGVVEMMRPYAIQHGFSIRTDLEQLKQTAFDSDAVKQIVVNLLDNAIKYARNTDDKTVTVRTKSDSQYVFIEVEDHGPGVPHRQRKKIFEEFYRTEAEATRETNGTGLGLALVKKFAQAHNGFVEILTAKPAGVVFRVGLAVQN
jgi:signal transduction histidine kinase